MFRDKVVLVTGGTTGIGAATSRLFARHGAKVIVSSPHSAADMEPFCQEIRNEGGFANPIACDITDPSAIKSLVEQINRDHHSLDILVNSAGMFARSNILNEMSEEVVKLFSINTIGTINMIYACVPLMRAGGGSIVNIASAAAILGGETTAAYSASKAALVRFTQTIAPELRNTGIRVNCVAPGVVRTGMLGFNRDEVSIEQAEWLSRRLESTTSPYGTAILEPEDIAAIVSFLASDESRAIHGACIVADQGMTAAMLAAR